jgi:hypothetical protein
MQLFISIYNLFDGKQSNLILLPANTVELF